jgi:DNA mismatch repair protein MLH3
MVRGRVQWCVRRRPDSQRQCGIAAIRFGDRLSLERCRQVVRQLAECDFPFQCAHGRPALLPLTTLPPPPDAGEYAPAPLQWARLGRGSIRS